MNKALKILPLLYLTLFLTGCWDKVEINNRAFVSGVGYDIYDKRFYEEAKKRDKGNIDTPELSERNRFVVTYVFPNLNAIGKNATSDKRRYVLSSVSNNPYEATTELATRMNKSFSFKHVKVIIFGEDFARNREYMKEVLDNTERHDQLSRKVYLLVAEGTAKDTIDVEDIIEPETGSLLSDIFRKKRQAGRYNSQTFEDILKGIKSNGSALMPRVVAGEKELKVGGSAVIKDYMLIGWLGELETRAVLFLKDRVESEVIDVKMTQETWLPFIITDSKTKKSAKISDDKITIDVQIEMEGYLQQYKIGSKAKLLDDKTIDLIEKKAEETLKKEIEGTIKKLQKEFKVDVIDIGDYLSKFKPDTWEKVKDDWNNTFSDIEINVAIDAKLRRIGMTK